MNNISPGESERKEVKRRSQSVLVSRTAAEIVPEEVKWLWPGHIPVGMVTMLDGDPGLGKSLISVYLAACVTTGRAMPGGEPDDPADVLVLAVEDDPARVIRPRLDAAGADLNRVHIIDGLTTSTGVRPVSFPDDLPAIEAMIRERRCRFVIIDPILAFLNGSIDSHRDQDARSVLAAVKAVAERTGAAFLLIRHLNKGAGASALYRGGGSIAFAALARSALLVGRHPDQQDTFVLASSKCNLTQRPSAQCYTLSASAGAPVVVWGGAIELTADELVATPARPARNGELTRCVQWLRETLKSGPIAVTDLEHLATDNGFSMPTLNRARKKVDATRMKERGARGCWVVALPDEAQPNKGIDSVSSG